jgi:hypothetical protein
MYTTYHGVDCHSGNEESSALQDAIAEVKDREDGELVMRKAVRQSVKDAMSNGQNGDADGGDSDNSESEDDDYAPPSDSEPEPEGSGNDTDDSGNI